MLNIKFRGNGKYELAKKIAAELVKKEMVRVAEGAKYNCLSRGKIVIEQELDLELAKPSTSELNSSSSSTMSVDDTDDLSSLSDFSDQQDVNTS